MILKLRKLLKILVGFLFLLLLLFTIGTALFIYFFPEERALTLIQNKAEEVLNTPVKIKSLNYGLKGITLTDITVFSSDKENQDLLKIEEASILFSLFSLLRDELHIWSISLNGVILNFYFNDDGTHNYSSLISGINSNGGKSNSEKKGKSIKISRIALNNSILNLGNLPGIYKPLQGEYKIDSIIDLNEDNIYNIHNAEIILPENRGVIKPDVDLLSGDKFKITGKADLEKCSLQWVYRFADNDPGLPFETVTAEVENLEITTEHIKGHAKGFSTLKKTEKKAVVDGWCRVDIKTLLVSIYDVKGTIDRTGFNLDSLVISGKRGSLVSFKASKADALIPDLRILLDFLPRGLYGGVKGSLSFDGKKYNGRLDLSECGLITENEIFSGLSTEIVINNNEFKKENIPVKISGHPCTISIATTGKEFNSFYIFIQSSSINLNEIINRQSSSSSEKFKSAKENDIFINGKIVINEITYDNIKFRNTNIDFDYSGSTIRINKISTSSLSGTITGNGQVSLSGSGPVINTTLNFRNIKIQDFPFQNQELKSRFFGLADGNASLSIIPGKNPEETIKGKIVFNISKGKVVNTGVQNGLILFLAELRYKLRDLEFNKIYGNIDLDTGRYNINSFIFNSEDIRLSLNGVLDSNLHAKNMQMKLEFNNHFIKDIPRPAVAVLNKYQSGRWYVMPFVIKGDITNSKNINLAEGNQ
jgi:hypothetical protein